MNDDVFLFRMLDEYFAEQMKEVIRLCSRNRQSMLFSATMTDGVCILALGHNYDVFAVI